MAAALAVVAGVRLFGGDGPAAPAVRVDGAAAAKPPSPDRGTSDVFVHVAGAVHRPGLIRLPGDARVATALDSGGRADPPSGPDPGEPRRARAGRPADRRAHGRSPPALPERHLGRRGAGAPRTRAKIHLSTATVDQLDEIDGIGPTLAERIVEYRDAHGGFRSIQELAEVEGIGEKRLATLREALQP